jgi:hypothetical protein
MKALKRRFSGCRVEYSFNSHRTSNNAAAPERNMSNNRHPLTVNSPIAVKTTKCIAIMNQNEPEINFFFITIFLN